jgi:hypothetical protein
MRLMISRTFTDVYHFGSSRPSPLTWLIFRSWGVQGWSLLSERWSTAVTLHLLSTRWPVFPIPQWVPVGPSLRASTEHIPIVRGLRAQLYSLCLLISSPLRGRCSYPAGVRGRSLTARVQPAHSDRARWTRKRDHPAHPASSSSHRPLFFLPRHLPKHPLVPRADHERLFHPLLLSLPRILYPPIHLRAHPPLHLGELR